jgi:hypothetical protein
MAAFGPPLGQPAAPPKSGRNFVQTTGTTSGRLGLDHVLVRMRAEFETYKEKLREVLKARYDVKPPAPKSIIEIP